jgi:hypothetical protein
MEISEWCNGNFLKGSAFALPKNFGIEHRTLNSALRT